jgi:hypothetical protein
LQKGVRCRCAGNRMGKVILSCHPRSPNTHFMCCPGLLSGEAIGASARVYASLRGSLDDKDHRCLHRPWASMPWCRVGPGLMGSICRSLILLCDGAVSGWSSCRMNLSLCGLLKLQPQIGAGPLGPYLCSSFCVSSLDRRTVISSIQKK